MRPEVIPIIIQAFLDKLSINRSDSLEKACQQWIPDTPQISDSELIHIFSSIGTHANLLFIEQLCGKGYLKVHLKKSNAPVLLLTESEGMKLPVIIHYQGNQYQADSYSNDGGLVRNYYKEFPEDLFNYLTTENDQIRIITCFPLNAGNDTLPKSKMTAVFSKLLRILSDDKKPVLYIFLYSAFAGIISLSLPLGVQSLIGFISSGQMVTSAIILIIFIILGMLLNGVLSVMQLGLIEFVQQRLFAQTAFSFAFRVPRIKTESLLKYNPPELMNRFFDTLTLQKGLSTILIDFSGAVLQTIFGIILLAFYHPSFLILGTVLIAVLIFILRITGPQGIKTSLKESAFKYFVANWLEEVARCLKTFKLAGSNSFATEKTDYFVSNYIKAREEHFKVLKVQYYSFILFKTLITALLLIFGAVLIINQEINLGQFIAAEIVIILLMNSIEKIILKLDSVYDVLVSVEKITDVTELPVENYSGMDFSLEKGNGLQISMQNVSYRYPDRFENSLQDINLSIKAGERIAIAGTNGAGKSTLINTLIGLHENYEGQITFNNLSLRNLNRSSLRRHIGDFMAQEGIFEGTIYENITVGRKDIIIQDVLWAIEAAGLSSYINSLPEGFNTKVVGGGIYIPDSIAKKIIIARNIALRPALLILDDFLLGIERSEKLRIVELLLSSQFRWTVILISNDPNVLHTVERVILMNDGRIHDTGIFTDLQKRNPSLRELFTYQTSEYEH